jgi:transposase InsO family protein
MNDAHMRSIAQLQEFLQSGEGISFIGGSLKERYRWIEQTLFRHGYFRLRKRDKSVVKQYIMKMTGYSDAQATRLIARKRDTCEIKPKQGRRHVFPKVYGPQDIALLAKVDKAHQRPNGKAVKKILEREYQVYGKEAYEQISRISASHIYNLRETRQYRSVCGSFAKTKPTKRPIGERRKPDNQGKPGYLRVDTVHQGDIIDEHGRRKGVYHINIVDEWVQWQMMGCVEGISERFLAPLLQSLIEQYPYVIVNVHSDNGSEYVNKTVAALLEKMYIHQTKSRPRRSNDNALAETKNGSVIRKHMGYAYIDQKHADKINHFYKTYMNPYVNFHRPCAFSEDVPDQKKKGKITKRYNTYLTPFERLTTHPLASNFLKKGVTMELLQQFASQMSDTEAAIGMQKAKYELFKSIRLSRNNII